MKILSALTFAVLGALPAQAETVLLVGEQPGCAWCERWTAEIGPIYPKTEAGHVAPLVHTNIHDPLPEGVALLRPMTFTPTFVIIEDGVEVSRLEGYPGEDFFWAIIEKTLRDRGTLTSPPES